MVRKPCASTAGAVWRGLAGASRRGTGTRTVSTEGAGSGERGAGTASGSLLRFRAKYPPTPAATTTSPITRGVRDRRRAAGSGVVGAPVIAVGASAVVRERGRGAVRGRPGEATGCSGQTAVA